MPPYLQPDQPPVGGWMLLGRIVFRDEQVELPGKGVTRSVRSRVSSRAASSR